MYSNHPDIRYFPDLLSLDGTIFWWDTVRAEERKFEKRVMEIGKLKKQESKILDDVTEDMERGL